MKPSERRPITVEDLLRLKRAERPAEDFWSEFDRQLRAKQLAALVEKRPWWREISLAGFFSGFRRYHLPLGATAIVALSFVSYRFSQVAGDSLAPATEVGQASEAGERPVVVANVAAPSASLPVESIEVAGPIVAESSPAPNRDAGNQVTAGGIPAGAAFGFSAGQPAEETSLFRPAVSGRTTEAGWNQHQAIEPVLSRSLLGGATRLEARTLPTRQVVEPLKQITPPAERRGARILTAMVSMASVENAMRTTERAASRLSEEELYEQIRRVGAFGAGVNVKF